jgi:hypothetical protein
VPNVYSTTIYFASEPNDFVRVDCHSNRKARAVHGFTLSCVDCYGVIAVGRDFAAVKLNNGFLFSNADINAAHGHTRNMFGYHAVAPALAINLAL